MKKRILSIVLVLCIVISAVPFTTVASAVTEGGTLSETSVKNSETTEEIFTPCEQAGKTSNTLFLHGNGGVTSRNDDIYSSSTNAASITVRSVPFTKKGYYFNCWNTQPDGKGDFYRKGATVNFTAAQNGEKIDLYAIWTANYYTVAFDANGGEGTMNNLSMRYDKEKVLTENTFVKDGFVFASWNTQSDGNGNEYADKAEILNLTDVSKGKVTLYAQWKDIVDPVISGIENGKTYCEPQTVTVSDNDALASVTVNENTVTLDDEGQFILSYANGTQKVVATDKDGNVSEMTVTVNDGHTYEWQNENGRYWKKCKFCDDETDKKDIPEITINGADKVCKTQDYHFTVDYSDDDLSDFAYGYIVVDSSGVLGGRSTIDLKYTDGVYCADISFEKYGNITSLTVSVYAKTSDGYTVSDTKNIAIQSEHTGGTANCTHKAICEVCGEEYGEVDSNNHSNLNHIEAKAATTEAEGNIEYWHCEDCDKCFSDSDCNNEIALADTVIEKLGETVGNPEIPSTDSDGYLSIWLALFFVGVSVLTSVMLCNKRKFRKNKI